MKFKRAKKSEVSLDSAVVGGVGVTSTRFSSKKKIALFLLGLVLVIAGAAVAYFVFYSNNEDEKTEAPAVTVESLTTEELKEITSKSVDAKADVDAARLKAEALLRLEDPAGAVVVYEQIEVAGTGNYQDTIGYAGAVLLTGDYQKSISLLEAAVKELNESSASQDVKNSESEKLNTKIRALKKEAGL